MAEKGGRAVLPGQALVPPEVPAGEIRYKGFSENRIERVEGDADGRQR